MPIESILLRLFTMPIEIILLCLLIALLLLALGWQRFAAWVNRQTKPKQPGEKPKLNEPGDPDRP